MFVRYSDEAEKLVTTRARWEERAWSNRVRAVLFHLPAFAVLGVVDLYVFLNPMSSVHRWDQFLFTNLPVAFALFHSFQFVVYTPMRRQPRIIWLRKFSSERGSRFRVSRIVDCLTRGGLSPITLQDSTVKFSPEQRRSRYASAFWVCWLLIFGAFQTWLIFEISAKPTGWFSPLVTWVMITAMALPFLAAFAFSFSWMLLPVLFRVIPQSAGDDYAVLESLLSRKNVAKSPRGAAILKVRDADWRNAIRYALSRVDAVIIDITEVGESIAWEIEETLRSVGRDRIVFIACANVNRDVSVGADQQNRIRELLGSDIRTVAALEYPRDRWSGARARKNFASQMIGSLYAACDVAYRENDMI